jgi:prepilin signal peptidase PulO-like enzyme (type II secretory pathway)
MVPELWLPWLPWLAALLGLAFGSFLNVCTLRWPLDQSVVRPPSRCPRCDRSIAWYDNLPVLSWVVLRGRCRGCGEGISLQYPLVELATAFVWAGAFWLHGGAWESLRAAILLTLLLGIALSDARFYIIPDEFSLGGAVLGVGLAFLPGGLSWTAALVGAVGGYLAFWVVGVAGTWLVRRLNPSRLETAFEEHDEQRIDPVVRARVARLRSPAMAGGLTLLVALASAAAWGMLGMGALLLVAPAALAGLAVLLAWAEAFDDPVFQIPDEEAEAGLPEQPASALGGGDVRMMALVGAFLGMSGVLLTVLGGSVLALVAAIPLTLAFRQLIPLGIFLAFAAAGTYLFGDSLVAWYLAYAGF